MLEEVRCIDRACDLDLLLFFVRHPRALLAAEQIFARIGCDFQQAAVALEKLVDAGIVNRSRGRTGAVCLYELEADGPEGAALRSLLQLATTPSGRRNIMRLLKTRLDSGNAAGAAPEAPPQRRAAAGAREPNPRQPAFRQPAFKQPDARQDEARQADGQPGA